MPIANKLAVSNKSNIKSIFGCCLVFWGAFLIWTTNLRNICCPRRVTSGNYFEFGAQFLVRLSVARPPILASSFPPCEAAVVAGSRTVTLDDYPDVCPPRENNHLLFVAAVNFTRNYTPCMVSVASFREPIME